MSAAVGDRIIVDSNKVGQKAREGDILEVVNTETGSHYVVKWDDGAESSIWPSGSVRTIQSPKKSKDRESGQPHV
jgi:hypothetical protein